MRTLSLIGVGLLTLGSLAKAEEPAVPPVVSLASDGTAQLPILIPPGHDASLRLLANDLAGALHRVTGATFTIQKGKSGPGIILATTRDFPELMPTLPPNRTPSQGRDDYLLQTQENTLLLIGRDEHGVQNALWDFLHRIGFRQYFPGKTWEIWPSRPTLEVTFSVYQSPSYHTRNLFLGGSISPKRKAEFLQWKVRNRMDSGFTLNTSHAYGAIISRNAAYFQKNPDDLVPGGKPAMRKFDTSRESVLQIVTEDALAQLSKQKHPDSISMDPSDGGGWREDSPLGSPSDQALALANHVARSIQGSFPGSKVGMYAYYKHAPPPSQPVDPNVIISVATAFLQDGQSPEGLMQAWQSKGAEIGVRDYLSVWSWDKDLPGKARGTEVAYLKRTISTYYKLGARYWTSEASDGWGSQGLGYYLASRLLWEVGASEDAILQDFYEKSFGPAADAMKRFFACVLGDGRPLLSSHLIGTMYRALADALEANVSEDTKLRIFDCAYYTRYVELWLELQNSKDDKKADVSAKLRRLLEAGRDTGMVNGNGALRNLGEPAADLPPISWSESTWRQIIADGIRNNPLAEFPTASYSTDLQPVMPPEQSSRQEGRLVLRGTNILRLHAEGTPTTFVFSIKGGLLYGSRGPVKIQLFAEQNPVPNDPVASIEIQPDKKIHEIALESPYPGAHHLEISDGDDGTEISWPSGQRAAWSASSIAPLNIYGSYDAMFFVPAGTTLIGGYSEMSEGQLEGPDGSVRLNFKDTKAPGYFSLPVTPSPGSWWRLRQVRGKKLLMTVPPWFSRTPEEALLPKEVNVEKTEHEIP